MDGSLLKTNVLVYGFYFKQNLGDDLFAEAFKYLLPNFNLIFTDTFNKKILQNIDVVFIGGGSFLNEPLVILDDCFDLLKSKQIFYIGVGAETDIHSHHETLIKSAKLIAIRSNDIDKIKLLNNNVIQIPDLVYCLPNNSNNSIKINKSVLILPNLSVVPIWNDPHWKHAAWEYFKTEFSQFLDELVNNNYMINFLSMSTNNTLNDTWATIEIINRMIKRNSKYILSSNSNIIDIISKYDVVISQRYHGIILSNIAKTPSISIFHHDKLKNISEFNLSYYGLSKAALWEQFNKAINCYNFLPIDHNIFSDLKQRVVNEICRG